MKSKTIVKYSIISITFLIGLYLFVDQIFIRGRLIETYQGEVISVWDNTNISGRNKSNIYQASVRLNNGNIVNIVCQRSCIVGQKLKVEKFMPLIGWTENYYSGT
ncbi:hypothetical protein [Alteromonas mediterranea]|uniref:Uncharacterized protein n=1 Tax=Alteromonas mediterranea (strain DSM 17117 / CIP 110805 / LMG 28347 / Deep ecotype) TaxID=1774373 RepID=F2G893_ALTMD|nr:MULTISPECIES: hypothetical protein [Alteromonas]AEA96794.1 hypothetical protein MADE_1003230 [Alteromonas mediterranea DE]CAH1216327.1 hypothetical protein ISS312_04077 [Alteromonas mediterranea]